MSRVPDSRRAQAAAEAAAVDVRHIPVADIRPDPTQPRQEFEPEALADLAASIKARGLLEPIIVRADPEGITPWLIVAGDRRHRAHQLIGAETIIARIVELDPADVLDVQIIENLQRTNITPLEEARAYQRKLDQCGGDVSEVARRLGLKQSWRITERTCLLALKPEYARLFATGNLTNAEAFHLAQLKPAGQDKLFAGIKKGLFPNRRALRAAQEAMLEEEQQGEMFASAAAPSADDLAAVSALERRIDQVSRILAAGFDENRIVAATRINPGQAEVYADKIALIRKHLVQMETALRTAAALRADLLSAA